MILPYHLAPHNATVIYSHIQLAFIDLQKDQFDFVMYIENIKKNNPAFEHEMFLSQDLHQNNAYQALLYSIKRLKTSSCKDFIINRNRYHHLFNDIEKKFKHFYHRQKQKLGATATQLKGKEKENLWTIYNDGLSQIFQPIVHFNERTNPDKLLTQAMYSYIQKTLYPDNAFIRSQRGEESLNGESRELFVDSEGHVMPLHYKNECTTIHKEGAGNVGEAMAFAIASRGPHSLKIHCKISGAFLRRYGMEPGLFHCCVLGIHTLGLWAEERKYKQDILNGAFEKGIPLSNISVISESRDMDIRDDRICFSNSERENLNKRWGKWANHFFSQMEKVPTQKNTVTLPLETTPLSPAT